MDCETEDFLGMGKGLSTECVLGPESELAGTSGRKAVVMVVSKCAIPGNTYSSTDVEPSLEPHASWSDCGLLLEQSWCTFGKEDVVAQHIGPRSLDQTLLGR